MVRHPRGSYMVIPTAVSLEWPHQKTKKHIGAVTHTQESGHKVPKPVLRAVLRRMHFPLHATRRTPHGTWRLRLVQAMPAWLVKTRRARSRQSRDARIYDGHTTAAMHKLSTPPPLPSAHKIHATLTVCAPFSEAHNHLRASIPHPKPE